MSDPTLEISDLAIEVGEAGEGRRAVDGISLAVGPGQAIGLVGESGSGKTLTARAVLGLFGPGVRAVAGRIRVAGRDVLGASERGLSAMRGRKAAIVFQDPMSALNPVLRIGRQIGEVLPRKGRSAQILELLQRVHLDDPERVASAYPHQLSGGMRQRVLIAMALAQGPAVLVADEPTTALDVTVQASILDLFREIRDKGTAILFITHDLAVASSLCTRIAVMRGGRILEEGAAETILTSPEEPYTQALLEAARWEGVRT